MLWDAALKQNCIREAPIIVVVCADLRKASSRYGERGERLYCIQDTAAAIQNMLLSITAVGLGGVWVGAFDEDKTKLVCGLPKNMRPVALIAIGYPKEKPSMPRRITFENLTWVDEYKKTWMFQEVTTSVMDLLFPRPIDKYIQELREGIKERVKKPEKKGFFDKIKKIVR